MKAYRVAEARARFGDLLDEAQGGETVFIERKGVRFTLEAERPAASRGKGTSVIEYVHPAVMAGSWTWTRGARGVRFRSRRRRS